MANKCYQCGKFLSPSECAKCSKCSSTFHRLCVNITPESRIPARWVCQPCKTKKDTVDRSLGCKLKSTFTNQSTGTESSFSDAEESFPAASFAEEIKLLRQEFTREMTSFRQELVKLNTQMNGFNNRVDDIEQRLLTLEQNNNEKNEKCDHSRLQETVAQLKMDLNDREQECLLNDVQITGIPERKNENVMHVVQCIAKKLGLALESHDIVSAERTGIRRVDATVSQEQQRSRPVVVRLTRRALRDDLLKSARVRRGTDTAGVIDGDPHRIYLNEHLTRTNRLLFYKAREEGRRHGWRYVWTRGGRIYMRRESDSPSRRIREEKDLSAIFCAT